MNKLENIVKNLIDRESEEEWFEFKENWYSAKDIGDYISSLSNASQQIISKIKTI
ncbi:hypothetical protein [Succinivibrio dextrinosolvens]|uniref:hypothetical protein n=1 Tax=Succinivibrio dextrinosolvens TaxID=83771 RepID=UPI00247A562C|nr:hypothetical protein [Succinivibrio dextrinosolvens]